MFKSVRIRVSEISSSIGDEQLSWEHSSLMGDFYFSVKPQSVSIRCSDEELYKFIKERESFYLSENNSFDIYDVECMPYVDAYNEFKIPIIKIIRAYSREQNKISGKYFSDETIDQINISYLSSWGFYQSLGRWYYKDNYVEMGDLLPIPMELCPLLPLTGSEIKIEGSAIPEIKNGKVRFVLRSNIPQDTPLIFSLRGKQYNAQSSVIATSSTVSEWFSCLHSPLQDGHYRLNVTCPIYSVLPRTVQMIFGERSRNITGKSVSFDPISGNTIRMTFDFLKRDDEFYPVEW